MITSKSIYHANAAILFKGEGFHTPDNSEFAALYKGTQATGARFLDDPFLNAKILILPELKTRIVLERSRLRVEDESQDDPKKSNAIANLFHVYEQLFKNEKIEAYGFNFDIFYRFNTLIPIKEIYNSMFKGQPGEGRDLLDVGIQYTFDNQKEKYKEVWFTKVVSPLELAVHINRHFDRRKLPIHTDMKDQFVETYEEADKVVKSFKFNI